MFIPTTIRIAQGSTASRAILADQKTSGTQGGTFTSGAWRTRDINTEIYDPDAIASIAANQITLLAGNYLCRIRCPAMNVNAHATRLFNVTDTALLVDGSTEYAAAGGLQQIDSWIIGTFAIGDSKLIEIQHQCQTTQATYGFGTGAGLSFAVGHEVFTVAEFETLM